MLGHIIRRVGESSELLVDAFTWGFSLPRILYTICSFSERNSGGEKRADESLIPVKCPAIYFWGRTKTPEHEESRDVSFCHFLNLHRVFYPNSGLG